jgi:hypothetical protein
MHVNVITNCKECFDDIKYVILPESTNEKFELKKLE